MFSSISLPPISATASFAARSVEATSAIDYDSERIIQDNMRQIAKGRTVIIIAHRLSAVRWTDRIITIDRGRLVEDGTHDELINTGGRYATLHRLQAGIHAVS